MTTGFHLVLPINWQKDSSPSRTGLFLSTGKQVVQAYPVPKWAFYWHNVTHRAQIALQISFQRDWTTSLNPRVLLLHQFLQSAPKLVVFREPVQSPVHLNTVWLGLYLMGYMGICNEYSVALPPLLIFPLQFFLIKYTKCIIILNTEHKTKHDILK